MLTRDPDGEERCVACNLCAVACPVGCISLQKAETKMAAGIRNFSALTSHAASSAACAKKRARTTAIQLTPDFELGEYKRQDLVYEKRIC
ncbi:NADH dehydrogenase subunit I [Salmonella enterica subsp. enterica]|uniref:NADH dehydrogenase subunit I n=1 Tax=Salmonella enterica I TaxID=59201 RepID=A0A3S5DCF4_SALET|nr:NADH dehydrogenase subunit I [Salmonella enterica subsp. enterica]